MKTIRLKIEYKEDRKTLISVIGESGCPVWVEREQMASSHPVGIEFWVCFKVPVQNIKDE